MASLEDDGDFIMVVNQAEIDQFVEDLQEDSGNNHHRIEVIDEENGNEEALDSEIMGGIDVAEASQFVEEETYEEESNVEEEDTEVARGEDSAVEGLDGLDKTEKMLITATNPGFSQFGNPIDKNPTFSSSINIASIIGARSWNPPGFFHQKGAVNRLLVTKVILRKDRILQKTKEGFIKKIEKAARIIRRSRKTNRTVDMRNGLLEDENINLHLRVNTLEAIEVSNRNTIENGKNLVTRLETQLKKALIEKKRFKDEAENTAAENKLLRDEVTNSNALALALDDPEELVQEGASTSSFAVNFEESPTGFMVYPNNKNELKFIVNLEKVGESQMYKKPEKFYIHKHESGGKFIFGLFSGMYPLKKQGNCLLCSTVFYYNHYKPFSTLLVVGAKAKFPSIIIGRICKKHVTGWGKNVSTLNVVRKMDGNFFKDL